MNSTRPISNDPIYGERLRKLTKKTLEDILRDRIKALEYAKKGIEANEPEKLTVDYLELVADGMQVLARQILKERSNGK